MRSSFLIALIIAIFFSGGAWYQSTAALCPVPLSYRIGEVNPSFNLSLEEAKQKVQRAEAQWEESVNRNLFDYDENADFAVNFIFDERQEASNAEERERRFLDGQLAENEELFEVVEAAQREYDNLAADYEVRVAAYERRLVEYNQTVQQYNDRGGAPESEFEALEVERIALNRESADLSNTVTQLNNLAAQINALSTEGNRLIDSYNEDVTEYNDAFGHGHEFTQGDYRGDEINIYEFSNDNELQAVLLHEFGHALGIDHIDATSSVMYYLLEEADVSPRFSGADLEAFYAVCGSGKEWDHQVRKAIRSVLAIF